MSKIETLLLCLSLACNIYLLISHHLHVGAVHKFNMMQMEINRAVAKLLELTKK